MSARRPYVVGLVIVIAALIAVNGYYFFRSQSPTYWDNSSYLLGSLTLYDALTDHGVWGFATAFSHLFGDKAPLISAFPIPVYLLVGRGADPRFLVGAGFLIVMSVYLFWLGERLWSPREGLLTVIILQTMPLMYGLSRQFLVDYGLATFVVMWMYYLLCFRGLSNPGAIARMGALLGAGMLMKVTFPMYVIAPTLAIVWFSLREVTSVRQALKVGRGLACILLIGGGIAASWYLLNWSSVLGFAFSAGFGKLSLDYGDADVFSLKVLWGYLVLVITVAVSFYYCILLLSLLPIRAAITWPRILKPSRKALALGLWIIVPLAVTSFGVNKDPRYTTPVMPAIALVLTHVMTDVLDRRAWLRKCTVVLFVIPILAYSVASFPALSVLGEARLGRWVFWSPHLAWFVSVPDSAGAWGQREILVTVCRDRQHSQGGGTVVVPLSHTYLNNNNLAYLSSKLKCDLQIRGLPGELQTAKQVADWLQAVKPSYVLVIPDVPEPELAVTTGNIMKEEVEQMVTRSSSGFSLLYRGPLGATGKEILIYRRISNDT